MSNPLLSAIDVVVGMPSIKRRQAQAGILRREHVRRVGRACVGVIERKRPHVAAAVEAGAPSPPHVHAAAQRVRVAHVRHVRLSLVVHHPDAAVDRAAKVLVASPIVHKGQDAFEPRRAEIVEIRRQPDRCGPVIDHVLSRVALIGFVACDLRIDHGVAEHLRPRACRRPGVSRTRDVVKTAELRIG